ncbi:MAG: carbohydrate kinase family protein [Zoogloeaceae bacterium]|jgi:adenosine kinase|nr:carbohydrate kinase family protein [Zoogloeaceae bacterium]
MSDGTMTLSAFSGTRRALICGSLAYDHIMIFQDRFKNHILPEKIHVLNVAFLVPEMRREFGGCAGNIAYGLRLLGETPHVMATVGEDFAPYRERLTRLGLPLARIRQIPGTFTAQAFITTDLDDNQITAFHPGAMSRSHENRIAAGDAELGIVAPDGRDGMLGHARDFSAAGIPFIFDPGQGLPMFSGEELLEFLELAEYACFNDYEINLASERTGLSTERLAERVAALIVTRGGEGSLIYAGGTRLEIPCAPARALVDPTGCGDAYRAGLLYGLLHEFDWRKAGQLASLMGALKIEHPGPQNYAPSREEIAARYAEAFGDRLF